MLLTTDNIVITTSDGECQTTVAVGPITGSVDGQGAEQVIEVNARDTGAFRKLALAGTHTAWRYGDLEGEISNEEAYALYAFLLGYEHMPELSSDQKMKATVLAVVRDIEAKQKERDNG